MKLESTYFDKIRIRILLENLGCEIVGRFANVKSFRRSLKKTIGRFAQKKLSLFLQIVHLQIKNRKNDLQIDLQLLRFSNQGVDLQVQTQISPFANLFSNRSQATTWNINCALLVASRFLSALSLIVNSSLSVSFSLPSPILLLIVASR
jgi:hypothetical protein